ncbi:ATP-dependent zinc metalloprotease FtsH-like [Camellia sinensis]|uniref:ATP-dependent zinc metalloprotease FtsH-like n=1 Tax=Camellia sinensis TaxID=4442 RepID=UPI0010366E3B|nr:ATP-dependent zinc metalloprotease FtsH-like [Camellia sinensis]
MAEVFAAFWYSIIGRLLCTNSRKEDQKEEKSGVQIFDLQHFDLYSPHQPMSASLAFTTEAMRLLEEEQKEKDPLKPKQPMSAFFIFRNELRAESKCGWEVIEEWNNMTEKQKKPYEKIAKQNMEKYLEEMEAYKQRKEEGVNKKLQQAVEWPLKHSAAFSRLGVSPVCGILLHGPPGCSKTTLAKAAAHATQASFFSLSGAELYSMYVGEGEALLHNTFRRARLAAPCIIFFDEADVAAKRLPFISLVKFMKM